jgi:predicted O-methyltransferase YrrM
LSAIQKAFWYLQHSLQALRQGKPSSSLGEEFVREVLPHRSSEAGERIRSLQQELAQQELTLSFEDLGAGFGGKEKRQVSRSLRYLLRRSARPARTGELLYRLCWHYQPHRALELGTHLGFSALYQMSGQQGGGFLSIEGAEPVARLAQRNFEALGFAPRLEIGDFDQVLARLDLASYRPDYVLIDGNHRYESSMRYFQLLLPHLPDGSLLVFDDINWSAGMRKAWREVVAHPEVSLSIDLFWLGLVFVRHPIPKEQLVLRL